MLVDFWTYSCVNCVRTIPHLRALQRAYGPDGLTVLGIHTPEFAFEADPGNVGDAIRRLGVTWPVALDARYATFRAWGVGFWPTQCLLDREGRVRYLHWGEGDEDRMERLVRRLLAVPADGARAAAVADRTPDFDRQTPETWLGPERLRRCRCLPLVAGRETVHRAPRCCCATGPAGCSRCWTAAAPRG